MQKRDLLKLLVAAGVLGSTNAVAKVTAAPAVSSGNCNGPRYGVADLVKPKLLQPGDTIGLVSPSAASDDRMDALLAQDVWQALGFKVKLAPHLAARYGHLAGTDQQRASDLMAMFADPQINGISCLRGGSGAARLLPLLDYLLIRRNAKVLLGYSDITALHNALYTQAGVLSFHGSNGSSHWNEFHVRQFNQLFLQRLLPLYQNEPDKKDELVARTNRTLTLRAGVATGHLLGGNLTVLTALAGSPYFPDLSGAILFLEDIEEQPYRLDRMFSTLKLSGQLQKIAGLVFGECTRCDPVGSYGQLSLDQILDDYILPLNVPAYRGAMIGHLDRQFMLPVGGKVRLDATAGTLQLLEPVFSGS